jgi:hypothetical protein
MRRLAGATPDANGRVDKNSDFRIHVVTQTDACEY